jgi:DnaK suppressor protein
MREIKVQIMIQDINLKKIRRQLEAELLRIRGNDSANTAGQRQRSGANLDRDDLAHNYSTRERERALSHVEQAKINQIAEAMERLDKGSYGLCAGCSEAIEPERLEIIPHAIYCINCQRENEQK